MPGRGVVSCESSVFLSTSPVSSACAAGDGARRWHSPKTDSDDGVVSSFSRSVPSTRSLASLERADGIFRKHSTTMTTVPSEDDERPGRHNSLSLFSETSIIIIRAALPFLVFLAVYGLNGRVPILPRAEDAHCVKLRDVTEFEESLLGRGRAPHLIVSAANSPVLDVMSAIPYLIHYSIPLVYPLYVIIFVRPSSSLPSSSTYVASTEWRSRIIRFYLLLGWSMWVHYAIWFVLPTAPPWVAANLANYRLLDPTGRPPPLEVQPREGCAFSRLDSLTGVAFFRTIFSGNPIPFASLPSGHVAWPTCVLLTQMRHGCNRRRRALLAIYVIWVSWATMYSCHHYMSDIVAAVVVVFAVDRLITCFRCDGRARSIILCCSLSSSHRVDANRKSSSTLLVDRSRLPSII